MEKIKQGTAKSAKDPVTPVLEDSSGIVENKTEISFFPVLEPEVILTPEQLNEPTEVAGTREADVVLTEGPGIAAAVIKNKVYGTYTGASGSFRVELRVDIDGPTPLKKISGDFYSVTGATVTYFGSFVAHSVTVTVLNGIITVTGTAQATWVTQYNKFKLTIKQTDLFQPLAAAQIQWLHNTTNAPGAVYVCSFGKRGFRSVRLEQDRTAEVTAPFVSYNTGSLPSGGPARVLSINTAYTEAGIDMPNAGISNVVPIALAGADGKWTDAELHNAMVNHFSLYQNKPIWDVWLLHAQEHITGPGLLGIMFDQQGLQRQGAAVFYKGIGGTTASQRRLQLYTCVHELGHCFNLLHSWQKSFATPPKPNIPNSLSWMNYPWSYPLGGQAAFWNGFPFRFDNSELTHIRHGFRNNVIMGGNPFGTGASLQEANAMFETPVENSATLELELQTHATYLLGEPVDLEIKLKTTTFKNNEVICNLHPDFGFVTVGIKKPGGNVVVFEPVAEKCIMPEHTVLNVANPSIYETAYIGFHKDGFIFDQPGRYEIRAVYNAEDGSRIVSDTITVRIKSPVSVAEDELADLFLEDEVGYLLKFKGSDASYLKKGNDNLDLVIDKFKGHPMAVFAQYAKGVNAQRTFKTITAEKDVVVRKPDFAEGNQLLTQAIEKSKTGQGLDNIRLNKAMRTLAKSYQRQGDMEEAQATMNNMVTHFSQQPIKPHVKMLIAEQAAKTLQDKS